MSNVQLAKDIYAAFGRDIPTAVLAGFHPEIEWRQAEGNPYQPDGAAWVGPQAVLEKLLASRGPSQLPIERRGQALPPNNAFQPTGSSVTPRAEHASRQPVPQLIVCVRRTSDTSVAEVAVVP